MTQSVTGADGTVNNFPDEATPEMIAKALGVSVGSSVPPRPTSQPVVSDPVNDKIFQGSDAGRIYDSVTGDSQPEELNDATIKNMQQAGFHNDYVQNQQDHATAVADGVLKPAAANAGFWLTADHYIQVAGRDAVTAGSYINPYTLGARLFDIPLKAGALATQAIGQKLDPEVFPSYSTVATDMPTFGKLFDYIGEKLFPDGAPQTKQGEYINTAATYAAGGYAAAAETAGIKAWNAFTAGSAGVGGQFSAEKADEWAKKNFPNNPTVQAGISEAAGLLTTLGIGVTGHAVSAQETIGINKVNAQISPEGVPLSDTMPEDAPPKPARAQAAAKDSGPTMTVPLENPKPFQDSTSGNLNMDYVRSSQDVKNMLASTAQQYAERSGTVVSHDESIALAQEFTTKALNDVSNGIPDFLANYNRGDPVNKAMALSARQMVNDGMNNYLDLAKKAAQTGTEEDNQAATDAWEKLEIMQGARHEMSSEAGRTTESHKIVVGDEGMDAKLQKLTEANLPPEELHKLAASLDTPQEAAMLLKQSRWENFKQMPLYYMMNNFLSGPLTHTAYLASWGLQTVLRGGLETPIASLVGKVQDLAGKTLGPEDMESLQAERDTIKERLEEADSKQGRPLKAADSVAMEARMKEINKQLKQAVTVMPKEAAARFYGIRDGFLGAIQVAGRALKSGNVENLPGEQFGDPNMNQNPIVNFGKSLDNPILKNLFVGGGTVIGIPGRVIGAIHSMQKAFGYSESMSALAYRQAASEGFTGSIRDPETKLGARIAELKSNPSPEMMQAAISEAKYAALMGEPGKLGKNVEALANTNNYTKAIVPFARVMNNLNSQFFLERTPVGLFSKNIRDDLLGTNGNAAQATAVGKMLAGTILLGGAVAIRADGLSFGQAPDDRNEKNFAYLSGHPPYSVTIGDTNWPTRFFGMPGRALAVGADLYDIHVAGKLAAEQGDDAVNAMLAMTAHTFGNNFLDESGMRGVANLYQAVKDPNYAKYYWPETISSMALPFSVGQSQVTRMIDPIMRQTAAPDFYGKLKETMMSKSPFFSSDLVPKVDIFGNPLQRDRDHSWADKDPVMQALKQAEVYPTMVQPRLFSQRLSEKQYYDYASTAGKLFYTSMEKQVTDPNWAKLSPDAQADAIDKTIKATRKQARQYMSTAYPQLTQDSVEQNQALGKTSNPD